MPAYWSDRTNTPFIMRIGIIVPLPRELKSISGKRIHPGGSASLTDSHWIVCSGMGARHAKAAADRLIEKPVDLLVSWGVAAGLSPSLSAGDLLLPEIVIDTSDQAFPTYSPLREYLLAARSPSANISTQPLHGAAPLLRSSREKQTFHDIKHTVAADMESAAIAGVARKAGREFLAIRAVSDTAALNLPWVVEHGINEWGQLKFPAFLFYLLARPREWQTLGLLKRDFQKAIQSLRSVAPLLLSEKAVSL